MRDNGIKRIGFMTGFLCMIGMTVACTGNVKVNIKPEEIKEDDGWRVTTESYYDTSGLSYEISYEYDNEGNMTKIVKKDSDLVTYYEEEYFKGNLKKKTKYNDDGTYEKSESEYTDDAVLLKNVETDYEGNVISEKYYEYNDDGSLASIRTSEHKEKETLQIVTRNYDDGGRLIGGSCYRNDELEYAYEMEYDSEGRLTKEIFFNENNEIDEITENEYWPGLDMKKKRTFIRYESGNVEAVKSVTEYDEEERTLSIKEFEDNEVVCEETYKYDEAGNKTEQVIEDADGKTKKKWKWDENGNCVRQSIYEGMWLKESIVRKFNENGLLVETKTKEFSPFKIEKHVEQNTYDDNNRLINEEVYSSIGFRGYYTYKYDNDGNLVLKIYYENGIKSNTIEYQYIHFDINSAEEQEE